MPIPEMNPLKVWKEPTTASVEDFRTAKSTYSKHYSCVAPPWLSYVLGFTENKVENLRSKLIKFCAYFLRSNVYCTNPQNRAANIKL